MITTSTPPSTRPSAATSPAATHEKDPDRDTEAKTGAESLPSLGLVLALLASTCVSALLALLLCCHLACRMCRPRRIHVQESMGHVEMRMVSQRILEHVQDRIGHAEERMVSQAAARAVDIIHREAATCRRGEDQVMQYCQNRSVNILIRVCRELTRLSRSKHTLVNILTIGQLEHP